ncbi:MAG: thioredoxin domain-containing protein [Acidobacteria bacterium]|nr:thioredoxin domain-containing protein [Acidobacteriota bacterium]
MKSFAVLLFLALASLGALAQKPEDVLATSTGHVYKLKDLSPEAQAAVAGYPERLKKAPGAMLEQMINEKLFAAEGKARNMSAGRLFYVERQAVPVPTGAEIQAFYDKNKASLGDYTIDQVRPNIIDFLRGQAWENRRKSLVQGLNTKYKVVMGKDPATPGLQPTDILATVNGENITGKQFQDIAKIQYYESAADIADGVLDDLDQLIFETLEGDEAKARNIDQSELIKLEITDRMKDFSDQEQAALQKALHDKLFAKYQVKITYKGPEPLLQQVTADADDPALGPAGAPVTVIMFSDFQCSACAATHPEMKKILAENPGKIRFVVRDFPLESIHSNTFNAAKAANAAANQGKFWEYIDILYKNQDAEDDASLKKYAAQLGLNAQQFELDFNSEKTAAEIRKDIADGETLGLSWTPSIFVNGIKVRDIAPEAIRAAINKALGK